MSDMLFKKILKKAFNYTGFNITRVPKKSIPKTEEEILAKIYYEEGRRFQWLEEYNIDCIIDIGANEGQFARKILTIFPEVQIHCFEPLQDVFKQLQFNFKDNKNVFIYNFGLGNNTREDTIFRNESSASSSLMEMLDLHKSNFDFAIKVVPEQITIKRLDDIFPGEIARPLLIKIDVQGYEKYVLEGGDSVIAQADVIIIEVSFHPLYADQPLFEDIYDYFKKRGYRYLGNIEQLVAPKDHKVLQADAVFIKSTQSIQLLE